MKKTFLSLIILFACTYVNADSLRIRVASYNVRYENRGDARNGNGWEQRCPVIANMTLFHDFDLMGTQECKHNQIEDLCLLLPEYAYIGIGREDGKTKGEYSAIFYKKNRFELLEDGNFWLSETPEIPSKGWDAQFERICTWGKFKDKNSGQSFYYFNLHLDHIGKAARKNSAQLVLNRIKELKGEYPAILSGDFNVDQNNESYILLDSSGILRDSYNLSPLRYINNGTFNDFNPNRKSDSRIDHIFVSTQFSVSRYAVLTDVYWNLTPVDNENAKSQESNSEKYKISLPSDHYPVVIDLNL
ncbi:MAG: endonuclease/exonuclease/phosphatase family protein [Dysgonamonadaceae bacterium]|jgi:endonuclease/exonuclease/phosphatase family metal-dependent hydrolase|nr:endonuclease/exonuclease/phosphatase family protein [Dysgonamonadaceae bacterium]